MKMGVFRWVISALLAFYPLYLISPAASPIGEKSFGINEYYQAFGNRNIPYEAFAHALDGFSNMKKMNKKVNDSILTIIDYSLPSTKERLFILDLKNKRLLKKSLVAHGTETGALYAQHFSNKPQSHQSSLGFFITGNTYYGKHGYSLRMSGIEKDINDNARERAIVFHAAKYVSTKFIEKYGRLGRSFGCPALPQNESHTIIDIIKGESCVFIFYPDDTYLTRSVILNSKTNRP
jgi:hypothetical protein